jgi:hypothetical protein
VARRLHFGGSGGRRRATWRSRVDRGGEIVAGRARGDVAERSFSAWAGTLSPASAAYTCSRSVASRTREAREQADQADGASRRRPGRRRHRRVRTRSRPRTGAAAYPRCWTNASTASRTRRGGRASVERHDAAAQSTRWRICYGDGSSRVAGFDRLDGERRLRSAGVVPECERHPLCVGWPRSAERMRLEVQRGSGDPADGAGLEWPSLATDQACGGGARGPAWRGGVEWGVVQQADQADGASRRPRTVRSSGLGRRVRHGKAGRTGAAAYPRCSANTGWA